MLENFRNYLNYELNRAELTVDAYMRDICQFATWLNEKDPEDVDFVSVTTSDVRTWLASLSRSGDSPRTIRRKSQSLRALFQWMRKTGLIKVSPMRDLPLPKLSKPLPDLVRPVEIENILASTEKTSHPEDEKQLLENLVVDMLYSLGLRRAELISLNDSDISFSKGEIKVTGKRSKQRVVPAPMKLLSKIQEWQSKRDSDITSPNADSPLLTVNGKRITAKYVYNIVHNALSSSTAKKKSPHALRHSFASAMLNGGADLDSVKEFLGHASIATTQIYTHISLNEIKSAYNLAHPRSGNNNKD